MDRRDFLRSAGVVVASERVRLKPDTTDQGSQFDDREYWVSVMRKLADPVLTNLANGTLRARMPVEHIEPSAPDRRSVTHLEAIGRLMAGLAPWIELAADETREGRLRAHYATLAHRAIARAVDPSSPDFMNFTRDRQPLVDAAFLAQGILRAPRSPPSFVERWTPRARSTQTAGCASASAVINRASAKPTSPLEACICAPGAAVDVRQGVVRATVPDRPCHVTAALKGCATGDWVSTCATGTRGGRS